MFELPTLLTVSPVAMSLVEVIAAPEPNVFPASNVMAELGPEARPPAMPVPFPEFQFAFPVVLAPLQLSLTVVVPVKYCVPRLVSVKLLTLALPGVAVL